MYFAYDAKVDLFVMPLLARAKRRVASDIRSRALATDSRQTNICAYLSGILSGGLILNVVRALVGWSGGRIGQVPIIANEGVSSNLQGAQFCCGSCQ